MLNVQENTGLRRPQEFLRKVLRYSTAIIGPRRDGVPRASPRLEQRVPSPSGCRTHAIADNRANVYHRCGGVTLNAHKQFSVCSRPPYQVHRSILVWHGSATRCDLIGRHNHWPCAIQNAEGGPAALPNCRDRARSEASSGVNYTMLLANIATIRSLSGAFRRPP